MSGGITGGWGEHLSLLTAEGKSGGGGRKLKGPTKTDGEQAADGVMGGVTDEERCHARVKVKIPCWNTILTSDKVSINMTSQTPKSCGPV